MAAIVNIGMALTKHHHGHGMNHQHLFTIHTVTLIRISKAQENNENAHRAGCACVMRARVFAVIAEKELRLENNPARVVHHARF